MLTWEAPDATDQFWTRCKLAFALPWRRFKDNSVLILKLEGEIAEKKQPRFSQTASMPDICAALQKAAYDPRVSGVYLNIDFLGAGWAKVQEIREHIAFFRKSGKFTVAYMKRGGEKEYFLASACEEIFIPPSAQLSLRGLSVQGTFLRGVLDKVGVEPQVKRIGDYKSAGDQLLRRDMSEAQREQLSALLDDIFDTFVEGVADARNKTREEVVAMLDEGIYDMQKFKDGGWVTDLKYSDEVKDMMSERTGGKEGEVNAVPLQRYRNVSPKAFGLTGKKVIAVVRESGAITGGSRPQGGQITSEPLIAKLRQLAKDKRIAAIVLRVDSPGGDALASDLMWREIQKINEKKPVIAAMGDVAASGGYYMAMAAPTVVAHPLTITGSIGVVTGKFNFAELFEKVGYSKEVVSRGQYAELLQDYRSFNDVEARIFDESAQFAYESFRNKAAESRGMQPEEMQQFAQGRVWSGKRALENRLIDHIGGIDMAVALAKKAADIPDDEKVTLLEVSRAQTSPLALLPGGGAALDNKQLAMLLLTDPSFLWATFGFTLFPFVLQVLGTSVADKIKAAVGTDGSPQLMIPEAFTELLGSSASKAAHGLTFPQAMMPTIDVKASTDAGRGLVDVVTEIAKSTGMHSS